MRGSFITPMVVRYKEKTTWKAVIQGQPDDHISDWRGACFRFLIVRGQRPEGYKSQLDCQRFICSMRTERVESEIIRASKSKGSWMPELTLKEKFRNASF